MSLAASHSKSVRAEGRLAAGLVGCGCGFGRTGHADSREDMGSGKGGGSGGGWLWAGGSLLPAVMVFLEGPPMKMQPEWH